MKDEESDQDTYSLFQVVGHKLPPLRMTMKVNNVDLELEVDTGASASIISEKTYRGTWREDSPTIRETAIRLKTYTGEQLYLLGVIEVRVE